MNAAGSEPRIRESVFFSLQWADDYRSAEREMRGGILLEERQLAAEARAQLWEAAGWFWLAYPPIGAVRFNLEASMVYAYPQEGVDPGRFERFFVHEWQPLVVQAWGSQVLHASAAAHLHSRKVAAFSGVTRAGKSTLGYALGQRAGWQQIADESLRLEVSARGIRLAPIPNSARLRPASAAHFGRSPGEYPLPGWPDIDLHLSAVFFLEEVQPEARLEAGPTSLYPLSGADAYPLFLQQAFAFTINRPMHNRQLIQDYLQILRKVKTYQLVFKKSFEALDGVLDIVEQQVLNKNDG